LDALQTKKIGRKSSTDRHCSVARRDADASTGTSALQLQRIKVLTTHILSQGQFACAVLTTLGRLPEPAVADEAYNVFVSYADRGPATRGGYRFSSADFEVQVLLRPAQSSASPAVGSWLEKALNAAKAAIILAGPHGLGNIQQYERDLAVCRQSRDPLSVESGTPEQTYAKFIVQAEAENSAALSD
jgi:hypothetical protein